MDKDTFKVLNFLSNRVFGSIVSIRHIVNRIFPYKRGMTNERFEIEKKLIIRFFEGIEELRYINFNSSRNIECYHKDRKAWFEEESKLKVLITLEGLRAVNHEKFNRSIILNNRKQVYILLGALLISIASVVISWFNYKATLNANNSKQQYLLPSKELIEQLKPKQPLPKTEIVYTITQTKKKNKTKKNLDSVSRV